MSKKQTNLDKYWQTQRLKNLYYELSAPIRYYYKSFIKVELKNGGHYFEAVVHDDPNDHYKLTTKGHRNAKRVSVVKNNGEPLVLKEFTCGLLYVPPTARKVRGMSFDDALCFVCDVDIARRKGLSIEEGVSAWLDDAVHEPTKPYKFQLLKELRERMVDVDSGIGSYNSPRIKELRKILTSATGEAPYIVRNENFGEKETSNKFSDELLKQFGKDDDIAKWVADNKDALDEEPDSKAIDRYKERWINLDYLENKSY